MFAEIRKDYLKTDAPSPLPFVICNIGQSENQIAVRRPEGFIYHHLLWVTQGTGIFQMNGKTVKLNQGEGFFCKRTIPHHYEKSGSVFSTRWITFLGGEGAMEYYQIPDAFMFTVFPALTASVDELDRFCAGSSTVLSRSAAGYSFFTDFLRQVFEPSSSPAARIRLYLENHFNQPLSLETIAGQVGMNRFSLCRYYKENQGITVMEQLKRIRIAKAKQFLRLTSCSIEEIGSLCGYESPSYFGKIFREETGQSPREYREQHSK